MSDSYLPGAIVLANSLRDAGTTKKLAVLVTMETLSADTISELKALYDYLIPVERIRNSNPANLYVMGRPDLAFAFTKIALWRQTQFRKLVYLDADVVALRALDELFDIEASFAAAPDIGWPDAFNSGVMVITPDMGEYWALQTMAATGDSFDGADQGLLNQYFEHRPWQRLKFTYNCTPNAEYQWEPAYRHYKRDIAAVHFIGKNKPWSGQHAGGSGVYGELVARWWAVHQRHLHKAKAAQRAGEAKSTHGDSMLSSSSIPVPTEASAVTTEPPMTEPRDEIQNIDQGVIEPTPTVEQRKFSAPEMQWDATRYALLAAGFLDMMLTSLGLSHQRSRDPKPPTSPPKRILSVTADRSSKHQAPIQKRRGICGIRFQKLNPSLLSSLSPSFHGSKRRIDPSRRACLPKTCHRNRLPQ
jgi:glycogenin glucosyltransferase